MSHLALGRSALSPTLRSAISSAGGFQQFVRANTPLPKNAHEVIESVVTRVGRQRLNIVSDIIDAGLVTPVPNWWSIPSLLREKLGEAGHAKRSFVPDTRGERQVMDRGSDGWPIYCTSDDFSFNIRTVEIAGRMNYDISGVHAEQATRNVNEAIEDQAINGLTDSEGTPMTINGLSANGILSSTNTFTYATWTGLTGPQILDEVKSAIELLRIDKFYGPFTMWVPGNYIDVLTKDYTSNYPKTVIARLQELGPYGGRNLEVRFADLLPNDRVVLAQMTSDVLDIAVGQRPTPVSWQDGPRWNTYWVVLACMVFRIFSNYDGNYGVAVGNLA